MIATRASRPLLEVENLSVSHKRQDGDRLRAVKGVSLSLDSGETLGLIGESGCGKTSLAYCLLRLLKPDGGVVRFEGEDWLGLKGSSLRRSRRKMQMVFQDPFASLNPRMRIQEIVAEPLIVTGLSRRDELVRAVEEALTAVGLDPEVRHRFPSDFSGGQRQRIAIARAIIGRPKLLIADEPVSALDASARQGILQLLRRLQDELGLGIILISHQIEVVARSCQRVAVMLQGSLVEVGKTQEVVSVPGHPYTAALLAAVPRGGNVPRLPELPLNAEGTLLEIGPGHWVRR